MSQKGELLFVANVKKYMVLSGVMYGTALAKRMHVSRKLLERRMKSPGDLTVNELRRMSAVLGMPPEEMLSLLR